MSKCLSPHPQADDSYCIWLFAAAARCTRTWTFVYICDGALHCPSVEMPLTATLHDTVFLPASIGTCLSGSTHGDQQQICGTA